MFFTKFLINDLPTKKCILNQKHWEKERNYYKKSQCTILLYYPIERKKYARICSVNVHVTICPLIYIPCVHMPPIIIPPFDIPREYIWKKEIIHQIYLSLYLANLLFFFSFSSLICCLSQSLIFFQTLQKKVIFGGPTKYTKKFLHSGIVSTVFCLIPEKTKREIIYLEHCLFLVSHLFVSPQPHISSQKNLEIFYRKIY